MRLNLSAKTVIFFTLIGVFLYGGCSLFRYEIKKREVKVSYKEASLDRLLELINRNQELIHSLTASLQVGLNFGVPGKYDNCNGQLLIERPHKIRLTGYRSLMPTIFLMVADADNYWVYIPSKKKAYQGLTAENNMLSRKGEEASIEDIKPHEILAALMLDDKITPSQSKRKAYLDILPNMYIINIVERKGEGLLYPVRRIWVEREELTVVRHELFDSQGRLRSEVYFRNHRPAGEATFPWLVLIKRPWEGMSIRLVFKKIKLNQPLNPEAFRFQPSESVDVIRVGTHNPGLPIRISTKNYRNEQWQT
ncbi:hypothetical protein CEE39_00160 [bacterium (candidate division B38) B3_B38]|nr:MAG: hypothetical protein CEE39_00160 [bacterium (candidate division B38) B3_B38]